MQTTGRFRTLGPMTDPQNPAVPPTRAGDIAGIEGPYAAMGRLDRSIELDPTVRNLVKIRASVLNGCAFCVDMHTTEARQRGETDRRLAAVTTWRHGPFFTPRERAALALTDALTTISNRNEGVPDQVWAEAREQFSPDELGNLMMAIVAINAWNRIAVATLMTAPPEN